MSHDTDLWADISRDEFCGTCGLIIVRHHIPTCHLYEPPRPVTGALGDALEESCRRVAEVDRRWAS